MAEIRLNASRMREIINRLDDIAFQLRAESDSSNGSISSINQNIKGDFVNEVITNYMKLIENNRESINKNIVQLVEYLKIKVEQYTDTEEEAKNSLNDIMNILKGLE